VICSLSGKHSYLQRLCSSFCFKILFSVHDWCLFLDQKQIHTTTRLVGLLLLLLLFFSLEQRSSKSPRLVVSNRIKTRPDCSTSNYALTYGVGFSIWRHTFKMAVMASFYPEKCYQFFYPFRYLPHRPSCFTQNVKDTEWPFICWCADSLTHSLTHSKCCHVRTRSQHTASARRICSSVRQLSASIYVYSSWSIVHSYLLVALFLRCKSFRVSESKWGYPTV